MKQALFVSGLLLLVAVELIRWLAGAPPEVCTGLSSVAWLMLAGPPAIEARAARRDAERGSVKIGSLLVLGSLVALALALTLGGFGCASTVHAERTVDASIKRGPPCRIVVRADGETVSTVTGPEPCLVSLPVREP